MAFIELKGLHKSYFSPAGEHHVLRNVNLAIEKGTFAALYGPSGSGKTTFLNMLTGIDNPTQGDITIDGLTINRTKQKQLTKWRGNKKVGDTIELSGKRFRVVGFSKLGSPGRRWAGSFHCATPRRRLENCAR